MVYTGDFARSVGAVGNKGRHRSVLCSFSKCPELHRRILEIMGAGEAVDQQGDAPAFHFSEVNYGDYGYFY